MYPNEEPLVIVAGSSGTEKARIIQRFVISGRSEKRQADLEKRQKNEGSVIWKNNKVVSLGF